MHLKVDGIVLDILVNEVSEKLDKASLPVKNDFEVSPSGYGIYWKQLDEDLSVDALIKKFSKI